MLTSFFMRERRTAAPRSTYWPNSMTDGSSRSRSKRIGHRAPKRHAICPRCATVIPTASSRDLFSTPAPTVTDSATASRRCRSVRFGLDRQQITLTHEGGAAGEPSTERAGWTLVPFLTPFQTRTALDDPARDNGAAFDPAALDLLVKESGGYPYMVQLLGQAAWETSTDATTITHEHARAALDVVYHQLDAGIYGLRWEKCTPHERAVLTAIALLEGNSPRGVSRRCLEVCVWALQRKRASGHVSSHTGAIKRDQNVETGLGWPGCKPETYSRGSRHAVIVQSEDLMLSTVRCASTLRTLRPAFDCAHRYRRRPYNERVIADTSFEAAGGEIDVMLEAADGRLCAIEVKAAKDHDHHDARHLIDMRDRLGERFVNGVVIHLGDRPTSLGDRITAMPLAAIWHSG